MIRRTQCQREPLKCSQDCQEGCSWDVRRNNYKNWTVFARPSLPCNSYSPRKSLKNVNDCGKFLKAFSPEQYHIWETSNENLYFNARKGGFGLFGDGLDFKRKPTPLFCLFLFSSKKIGINSSQKNFINLTILDVGNSYRYIAGFDKWVEENNDLCWEEWRDFLTMFHLIGPEEEER